MITFRVIASPDLSGRGNLSGQILDVLSIAIWCSEIVYDLVFGIQNLLSEIASSLLLLAMTRKEVLLRYSTIRLP